jgi:hypothetical protein
MPTGTAAATASQSPPATPASAGTIGGATRTQARPARPDFEDEPNSGCSWPSRSWRWWPPSR